MLESKNLGRALSVGTGGTIAYLVNRIQKERQPTDLLGYFLKASACYFLGQHALENNDEAVFRAVIGYMSYETVRTLPYGKIEPIPLGGLPASVAMQGPPSDTTNLVPYGYNPYDNQGAISSVLTPENLQNVGVALRGISSFINGFQGKKE